MKRSIFVLAGAGFWLLALIAASIPAQQQVPPPQKPLQHEIAVTLKLIQVYVTDKKGKPARDLEKSDFIIYDNDKPRIITEFEKHFLFLPEAKLAETKPSAARDTSSLMNRKFIFVIDFNSNELEGIAKSRNAALHFLDTRVLPGDEIALFSNSFPKGLTLHEYLTTDHQKIRTALDKVLGIPGVHSGWDSFVALGHSVMGMEALAPEVNVGASLQTRSSNSQLSSGLKNLGMALRHIPGQKNIILFSRGFGGMSVLKPGTREREEFVSMGRELASANSPVFSVDTTTGVSAKVAAGVFPKPELEYLSQLTGGKYYKDVDYYSQIAEDIQNSTSNYYVLGYSIESSWDGKFHDIKVEVKREGYKVNTQRGYFNPLPFSKLSPAEKHLHLLDLALGEKSYFEQQLHFPMISLPFSDDKDPNTILLSEIPVRRIRDEIGTKTEFISLIFDQNKSIVDSKRAELDWAAQRGDTICQYSAVTLNPGRYDGRIVIRNLETGKAAVGACSVEIAEKAASGLKLYPPLLLADGQEIQYLNIAGQRKNRTGMDVSLNRIYPFPAKGFVPLAGELKQGTSSFYALLRSAKSPTAASDLQISAWLAAEDLDEKIPMEFRLLSAQKQEEIEILFLEFKVPELRPGRYSLHLLAEDPAAKSSSETKSELIITAK
ncbi:MAG: VWA domain-containing protein [Candidatus Aminicenantes bacterium]|nr:VWA domain-containing protein [Candidatus Aminicenantes bacterium]